MQICLKTKKRAVSCGLSTFPSNFSYLTHTRNRRLKILWSQPADLHSNRTLLLTYNQVTWMYAHVEAFAAAKTDRNEMRWRSVGWEGVQKYTFGQKYISSHTIFSRRFVAARPLRVCLISFCDAVFAEGISWTNLFPYPSLLTLS